MTCQGAHWFGEMSNCSEAIQPGPLWLCCFTQNLISNFITFICEILAPNLNTINQPNDSNQKPWEHSAFAVHLLQTMAYNNPRGHAVEEASVME